MISLTHKTFAPSKVMRRAMMSPISPDPKMTTRLPGNQPFKLTYFCAVPALNNPAGRVPAILSAPLLLSLHPMARMTAFASIVKIPLLFIHVTRFLSSSEMTNVSVSVSILRFSASSMNLCAYSGPVRFSLKRVRPKPLWIHCFKTPPTALSRSTMTTSLQPAS